MTTAPSLELRALTSADLEATLRLLELALAGGPTGERSREFFEWKHQNCPFGESPGLVATHEGTIVGVRLFLRWELVSATGRLRAVRAVDTATHPDFQRQGIFRRLTMELLEQLEADGTVDLVFNTPNADSRPGYLRMGWHEVGVMPIHVAPVRPLAFARGMRAAHAANASGSASAVAPAPSAEVRTSPLPPAAEAFADEAELGNLIAEGPRDPRLHTPLSLAYLQWRYVDAPGLDYRCLRVHHRGRLVALGFGRMRRRAGLTEFTLGDALVRAGDSHSAGRLLSAARRSGADHVTVHAAPGSEVGQRLLRRGYLRAPGGIRLFANPRTTAGESVLRPESWRLSLGDLEVF